MGQTLSLAAAAKFAGVTQATMKTWLPAIEGVQRGPKQQYLIPEHSLRVYLLSKSERKLKGASATDAPNDEHKMEYLIEALKAENDRMRRELQDSREECRELNREIRKLEAELRATLAPKGLAGAVSRWIKSK
jgi:FtsZ-binding cell division protein ZapB